MTTARDDIPSFLVENGLDLSALPEKGSTLEIHDCEEYEPFIHSNEPILVDTLGRPPDMAFEDLAKEMDTVDDFGYVKKKILEEGGGEVIDGDSCTVGVAYSAYWEGEKDPFDLKPAVKPLECDMKEGVLLPGLQLAVSSMRVGELSMFLLSYVVMYGKLGNPPRFKPKSDCLYYIRLVRSHLTPDIRKSLSEPHIFDRLLTECKTLYMNGWQLYKNSNIPMAIHCFNKAVNIMHRARLADDEEERKQEKLLLKLYLNLAICYNNSRNPRRACCMCNEINRLQNIWKNGKALYQNAKALRMIGQFDNAKRRLVVAMKLCPGQREEMEEELRKINAQCQTFEQSQLFDLKIEPDSRSEEVSEKFRTEVRNLMERFAKDEDIYKIALPKALNPAEVKYVQELAQQYKFSCVSVDKDVSLDKMPASDNVSSNFDD